MASLERCPGFRDLIVMSPDAFTLDKIVKASTFLYSKTSCLNWSPITKIVDLLSRWLSKTKDL